MTEHSPLRGPAVLRGPTSKSAPGCSHRKYLWSGTLPGRAICDPGNDHKTLEIGSDTPLGMVHFVYHPKRQSFEWLQWSQSPPSTQRSLENQIAWERSPA